MRILIAEDDLVSRRMLAAALNKMGHEVVATENGRAAWDVLQREDIRLVIADWEMPEMDGLELVRRVRGEARQSYVYLILLTSRNLKEDIVVGLDAGADDYITKPFDREELRVRIRAGQRVTDLESQLEEKNDMLRRMALVDGLTGIANRRSFDEDYARWREHARRFKHPLTVIMMDIDRFKLYNDTLGHEKGDVALKRVAGELERQLRNTDKVYRYGGEEFVALLPETSAPGVPVVANRLRSAVEALAIPHPANPPGGVVTISLGLSTYDPADPDTGNAEEGLGRADQALYAAKTGGRNRVEVWSPACVAKV